MHLVSSATGRSLDEIRLREMQVPCVIGIYPAEALRTQVVNVQLRLFLDTRAAAERADLSLSVDYATLAGELQFLLQQSKFGLLETAAEALMRFVLAPSPLDTRRAEVEAASLELSKPEALPGLALPSLKVFRYRGEVLPEAQEAGELIFSTPDLRILRYTVEPGQTFAWQNVGWSLEALRTIGPGLESEGQIWGANTTLPQRCLDHLSLRNESFAARSFWCVARKKAADRVATRAELSLTSRTTH